MPAGNEGEEREGVKNTHATSRIQQAFSTFKTPGPERQWLLQLCQSGYVDSVKFSPRNTVYHCLLARLVNIITSYHRSKDTVSSWSLWDSLFYITLVQSSCVLTYKWNA